LQDRMARRTRTDRTRGPDVPKWKKVFQQAEQDRRLLFQARVLGWGKEKRYYFARKAKRRFRSQKPAPTAPLRAGQSRYCRECCS
jgi:hypothetical protein